MLRVEKISADSKDDFYQVNCDQNGLGWCNCVAWWCETWEQFGARSAEQNRGHRQRLFDEGEYDGFILYNDGVPIGWSQVGRRNRLPNLVKMYGYDPRPDTVAITCFALRPEYRGKGVVKDFLNLIVADLIENGNKVLQGFPKRGADDPWTGPESAFLKCGFKRIVDHEKFPVYERCSEIKSQNNDDSKT